MRSSSALRCLNSYSGNYLVFKKQNKTVAHSFTDEAEESLNHSVITTGREMCPMTAIITP